MILDFDDHDEPEKINVHFPYATTLIQTDDKLIHQGIGLELNTFSRKDLWYNLFEEEIVHTFMSYSEGLTQISPTFLQHDPK